MDIYILCTNWNIVRRQYIINNLFNACVKIIQPMQQPEDASTVVAERLHDGHKQHVYPKNSSGVARHLDQLDGLVLLDTLPVLTNDLTM